MYAKCFNTCLEFSATKEMTPGDLRRPKLKLHGNAVLFTLQKKVRNASTPFIDLWEVWEVNLNSHLAKIKVWPLTLYKINKD